MQDNDELGRSRKQKINNDVEEAWDRFNYSAVDFQINSSEYLRFVPEVTPACCILNLYFKMFMGAQVNYPG